MPRQSTRRSTKHRGNAAGMIEARGRTGRKPTASERGGTPGRGGGRGSARPGGKPSRYDTPPTWRSAAIRSVIAAVLVYFVSVLILRRSFVSNLLLLPIVLVLYMPLIYYTDLWLYRRRQRQKARAPR
ncbi:MAG TPA: hypothetical protein VL977_02825 [Solirubrobacteraceae bacterium]|nr:hypothetical protein [Solirubrobacteraceae bacterium]